MPFSACMTVLTMYIYKNVLYFTVSCNDILVVLYFVRKTFVLLIFSFSKAQGTSISKMTDVYATFSRNGDAFNVRRDELQLQGWLDCYNSSFNDRIAVIYIVFSSRTGKKDPICFKGQEW